METEYEALNGKDFHPAASDTSGSSERTQFRASPSLLSQLQIILESHKFPYRARGELIRHALIRHVYYLQSLSPIRSVMSQVEMINVVLYEEELAEKVGASIERLNTRITKLVSDSENGEAVRLIRVVQDMVNEMHGCYWKRKYQKEIRTRYGHLLKAAPRMTMSDMED